MQQVDPPVQNNTVRFILGYVCFCYNQYFVGASTAYRTTAGAGKWHRSTPCPSTTGQTRTGHQSTAIFAEERFQGCVEASVCLAIPSAS